MIQIYYGLGKGKTTAAIGAGMRAHGAGLSVSMVQFLKSCTSSELKSIPFEVFRSPKSVPFKFDDESFEEYKEWVTGAFEFVMRCESDVIILDEILDLVDFGFAEQEDIISLISGTKEYILTGHGRLEAVFNKADYVSRIECEKHPYYQGCDARLGFEF